MDDKQANGSYGLGMAPSGDVHRILLRSTDGASTWNINQPFAFQIVAEIDSRLESLSRL